MYFRTQLHSNFTMWSNSRDEWSCFQQCVFSLKLNLDILQESCSREATEGTKTAQMRESEKVLWFRISAKLQEDVLTAQLVRLVLKKQHLLYESDKPRAKGEKKSNLIEQDWCRILLYPKYCMNVNTELAAHNSNGMAIKKIVGLYKTVPHQFDL